MEFQPDNVREGAGGGEGPPGNHGPLSLQAGGCLALDGYQALAGSHGHGMAAAHCVQFSIDIFHMEINRGFRHVEDVGDLPRCFSVGQPLEHFALSEG